MFLLSKNKKQWMEVKVKTDETNKIHFTMMQSGIEQKMCFDEVFKRKKMIKIIQIEWIS